MSRNGLALNNRALRLCEQVIDRADDLRVRVFDDGEGAVVVDCGIEAEGGLQAGLMLARICLADLAVVEIVPGESGIWHGPAVAVRVDQAVAACLATQYAGWEIKQDGFFAMGSGPMRSAAGKEPLIDEIGCAEVTDVAVGVLETRQLPDLSVAKNLADACDVDLRHLTLLVAPTASQAGNLQIVARSVETALHKMHELQFDLSQVVSGFGTAPLPPVASDDMAGIGRTNDAILYGAEVTLWVRCEDDGLASIVDQIPSCASQDHGRPFAEIFAGYDHDFYKIDPHLFSPAAISLVNLDSGKVFHAGRTMPDILKKSFLA